MDAAFSFAKASDVNPHGLDCNGTGRKGIPQNPFYSGNRKWKGKDDRKLEKIAS
jgi:hypothetical protein